MSAPPKQKKTKRSVSDDDDAPKKKSRKKQAPRFNWEGANAAAFDANVKLYGLDYKKVFSILDEYNIKVFISFL